MTERERASSVANFTSEELQRVRENYDYTARRFPEDHQRTAALIQEKGLGDHRLVLGHYAKNRTSLTPRDIAMIDAYRESMAIGPFGKGDQSPLFHSTAKPSAGEKGE